MTFELDMGGCRENLLWPPVDQVPATWYQASTQQQQEAQKACIALVAKVCPGHSLQACTYNKTWAYYHVST